MENFNNYEDSSGIRANLRDFYNVEFEPLLPSKSSQKIIDLYPPPSLHAVRLGGVSKIYGELSSRLNLKDFEAEINIQKSEYRGGQCEGNELKKILKNITKLEDFVDKEDSNLLPFVASLWHLNVIDDIVNKDKIDEDFEEAIALFRDSYGDLKETFNISESNKIHVIVAHLSDFMKRNNTSLKKYTDQVIESTHSKLDKFFRKSYYVRKNNDDPSTGDVLCNGILT